MRNRISLLVATLFITMNVSAQQWNGYTLYSLQNSLSAYLMDTNLTTYHTWTFPSGNATGYSTHMEPGGTIVRAVAKGGNSFTGGPICGRITKHDYAGNLTWTYDYSTTNYCTHHDICPMPNGNVLVIAYERKTAAEVTAAGGSNAIEMWPDKIVEIQPTGPTTGTVVWEWHTWDHLVQNVDASKANYQTSIVDHPELININYQQAKDWQHMNGVDYNPILDQIAFSSHNMDEWYIIDHSTTTAEAATHAGGNSGKGGDILYRWGNPAAYGASGTAILNVTHDAHWIPEGVPNAGRLAGFNNRGVSNSQSAADEIITPINGYNYNITLGQAYAPATYTARHACNGYSSNMGSTQQLPNGNQLICIATSSKVYEINSAGTQLWTKTFTGGMGCSQARKYDSCYIFNTPPAIPAITGAVNVLTSTPATTYQWYLNGVLISGANSQTYNATQSGIYVVRITDANGCVYRYSPGYKHTQNADAVADLDLSDALSVYPNPTNGTVNIKDDGLLGNNFNVLVIDIYGRTLMNVKNNLNLNLSELSSGMYTLVINSDKGMATKKVSLKK
ncbi:MAG: aryl-sulfate sulfotransferase [Chitinophagaceae bacterium]|nr:aryl-sulfate sulfotransferase [Chitinophagaceae bacterium]